MVVTSAALYMHVQVFLWTPVFSSLGCIPGDGIAGFHDKSTFGFLRKGIFFFFFFFFFFAFFLGHPLG